VKQLLKAKFLKVLFLLQTHGRFDLWKLVAALQKLHEVA
jgi:hypothetical protein